MNTKLTALLVSFLSIFFWESSRSRVEQPGRGGRGRRRELWSDQSSCLDSLFLSLSLSLSLQLPPLDSGAHLRHGLQNSDVLSVPSFFLLIILNISNSPTSTNNKNKSLLVHPGMVGTTILGSTTNSIEYSSIICASYDVKCLFILYINITETQLHLDIGQQKSW